MAPNVTETTPLLNGFAINMPTEKDPDLAKSEDFAEGLSLEQLMPFDNDPWWQNARKLLMMIFWVSVFATLAAACIIAFFEHNKGLCSANRTITKKSMHQSLQSSRELNATYSDLINNATAKFVALAH